MCHGCLHSYSSPPLPKSVHKKIRLRTAVRTDGGLMPPSQVLILVSNLQSAQQSSKYPKCIGRQLSQSRSWINNKVQPKTKHTYRKAKWNRVSLISSLKLKAESKQNQPRASYSRHKCKPRTTASTDSTPWATASTNSKQIATAITNSMPRASQEQVKASPKQTASDEDQDETTYTKYSHNHLESLQFPRFKISTLNHVSDRQGCGEEVNFNIGCLNMLTRMYQIGRRQHYSKNV